jgi:hypothetical protein
MRFERDRSWDMGDALHFISRSRARQAATSFAGMSVLPKPAEKPAEFSKISRCRSRLIEENSNDFSYLEWRARRDSNS